MRTMLVTLLLSVAVATTAASAPTTLTGNLARDAELGFTPARQDSRLVVTELSPDSAAARAGLRDGDILAQGVDADETLERLRRHDGGQALRLEVQRSSSNQTIAFTPPPAPLPQIEGFVVELSDVEVSDAHLRTLIAVPGEMDRPRPALFLVQWVSCGSVVDWLAQRDKVMTHIGRELDMVILLAERSSDGDSEGPACHELDYDTEIEHYAAAISKLRDHPAVDPDAIYLYGSSLGSTTAPLIAQRLENMGTPVAGVAVQGGGALTYFERMLHFDRQYLERRPSEVTPADIFPEMQRRIVFHVEYLIKQRHPDDVAQDNDAMAQVRDSIRGMSEDRHYGRPFRWHQQAAQKNFLAAWTEIEAEVLVMFTEFDQYETEHGHRVIAEMINRLTPGRATYRLLPGLGHSSWRFANAIEAYADVSGYYDPVPIRTVMGDWLRGRIGSE